MIRIGDGHGIVMIRDELCEVEPPLLHSAELVVNGITSRLSGRRWQSAGARGYWQTETLAMEAFPSDCAISLGWASRPPAPADATPATPVPPLRF